MYLNKYQDEDFNKLAKINMPWKNFILVVKFSSYACYVLLQKQGSRLDKFSMHNWFEQQHMLEYSPL